MVSLVIKVAKQKVFVILIGILGSKSGVTVIIKKRQMARTIVDVQKDFSSPDDCVPMEVAGRTEQNNHATF